MRVMNRIQENELLLDKETIGKEAKLVFSNNSISDKINDLVVNDTFKDLGGT